MGEEEQELQDQPIYFSRRHYLTLGTLLAGLIALGSALYTALEKFYIAPKDQKIQQLEQTIANTHQENKALSLELQNTSQTYKNLLLGFYQFTQPLVPLSRLYGEPWDFFGSFSARSL